MSINKDLMGNIEELKILVDGSERDYTFSSVDETWLIYLTYQHSIHEIVIKLVPLNARFVETPFLIAIALGIIIGTISVIFIRTRKKRTEID
jgi:hypothetical protein